ncbi:MAG: sigma 54-interacting transcriptional regulator [Myxococcota bacterium]
MRERETTETDLSGVWGQSLAMGDPLVARVLQSPARELVDRIFILDHPLVIGRDPGPAGLAVADGRVSGKHAALFPDDHGALHVRDLGSKNGTFVDGVRTAETQLGEGALLRLGATLICISRRGPTDPTLAEEPEQDLVGLSPRFRETVLEARKGAMAPTPVLLLGASGTGKEGLARLVHRVSGRGGPFVAVNCATLGGELATAMLFGHERAAFTGANVARKGFFRAAEGGTLFLDEVGELPEDVQARLLRALEQREVTPVGATTPSHVDVRVVAATNADLSAAVINRRFRGDLYARLAGWSIHVPLLRERREDVMRLARHFTGPDGLAFEVEAAERLVLHDWPFNVRELKQLVQRLAHDAVAPISIDRLPPPIAGLTPPPLPPAALLESKPAAAPLVRSPVSRLRARPPRDELLRVLELHAYNVSAVARELDRDRKQIYRWLNQYGIALAEEPQD